MRNLYLFAFLFLLWNCQHKNDIPIAIKLHDNWEFKGQDTLNWQQAKVPGNIYSDLISNQIIKDPFIKTNEDSVQWVSKKDWIYKTNFKLSKKVLAKKNIALEFEGLDTYTTIFLNDSLLGKTDNAFRKWTFNIKKFVKNENELRIVFRNTDAIETNKETKNPYQLPEGKRVYTRKAQFQYGWDWGPKLNTSGIWKDVFIKAWNDFKINNVYIKNSKITETKAELELTINADKITDEALSYEVFVNSKWYSESKNAIIPIQISNPKLWWTHNLGEPYLYDIKVVVKKDKQIVDSISTKYGIRTINLITKKDSIGESFYFQLNGKSVYMKGANYIPQNSFQNKVTNAHYEKIVNDAVDANMNMLRVWGGGIYENDIFYNLCDEKGILVWQDFMFACAMYPGENAFLNNIKIEAEQQVKRLRNHASIALWCGNNENSEGWKRWGWQANRTKKEKQDIWNDYLAVFDSILPNVVKKYSQTSYWKTSPKFGRGNKKYKTEGDAHDWWIWHDAYPFEHLQNNVPRFMSEFGFQAFPSFEVINYINQKDSIDLQTDAIKSHQKHARGFQLINEYMKRDYKIPTKNEDYVYVSQLLQAKGIVMGIEAQRRTKPYNMGTLYWQLNDCWPAISWSSLDYFGNWKALHYKVKNAYKNTLISIEEKQQKYGVYIVNDNFNSIQDTLTLKIIDFYGKEIWSSTKVLSIEPNSSKQVYNIPNTTIDKTSCVLVSVFGKAESNYFFEKPKNLKLPKGTINQQISKTNNGFIISLKSNVLQKDVFLYTKTKGHFSENFFDLLPNESKTIFYKSDANTLTDLQIKTLNSIY
ncbi:MAG: glycoside hydrolase family 2 protein [Flavobacteriaceae bacterium]|nr:glycoside hydrolase family 2 protein [Flavobacteriaceae bacterium]